MSKNNIEKTLNLDRNKKIEVLMNKRKFTSFTSALIVNIETIDKIGPRDTRPDDHRYYPSTIFS